MSGAPLLPISRTHAYYQARQPPKDIVTKQLIEATLSLHRSYGHKRIALHLKVNKKRIIRVMKLFNIKPYRRKRTPRKAAAEPSIVCLNVLRTMIITHEHQAWVTDFTYIWFHRQFIYVATVMDVYTRQVVGVSILTRHTASLVVQALVSALMDHQKPEVIHMDRGSEYTSGEFTSFCVAGGIVPSYSDPGSPWQNAFQESFYDKFKVDLGDPERFTDLGELIYEIHTTIHYYNTSRIHTALKMSPLQFAQKTRASIGSVPKRNSV